jgi:hypothetical protein
VLHAVAQRVDRQVPAAGQHAEAVARVVRPQLEVRAEHRPPEQLLDSLEPPPQVLFLLVGVAPRVEVLDDVRLAVAPGPGAFATRRRT